MADGSVGFLSSDTPGDIVQAAITIDGRENIPRNAFTESAE
jgi:hypothetical protein